MHNRYNRGVGQLDPFRVPAHLRIHFETCGDNRGEGDTLGAGEGGKVREEAACPSALRSEDAFRAARERCLSLKWTRKGLHEDEQEEEEEELDASEMEASMENEYSESEITELATAREIVWHVVE